MLEIVVWRKKDFGMSVMQMKIGSLFLDHSDAVYMKFSF